MGKRSNKADDSAKKRPNPDLSSHKHRKKQKNPRSTLKITPIDIQNSENSADENEDVEDEDSDFQQNWNRGEPNINDSDSSDSDSATEDSNVRIEDGNVRMRITTEVSIPRIIQISVTNKIHKFKKVREITEKQKRPNGRPRKIGDLPPARYDQHPIPPELISLYRRGVQFFEDYVLFGDPFLIGPDEDEKIAAVWEKCCADFDLAESERPEVHPSVTKHVSYN